MRYGNYVLRIEEVADTSLVTVLERMRVVAEEMKAGDQILSVSLRIEPRNVFVGKINYMELKVEDSS